MAHELIIRHGTVIDGTGADGVRADVAIDGERITAIGDLSADTATREIDATGLFIAIGHDPRTELIKGQIDLDEAGYVLTPDGTTATNLPGVFVAGDVADSRYRQAITAAGMGCAAALDTEKYLFETAG